MLYHEFLAGTGAVDNQDSYNEYKRVEQIYMDAPTMTKADAYRMAVVFTEKEAKKQQMVTQKKEIEWVLDNVRAAASFVKAWTEKNNYFARVKRYCSECQNVFELRVEGNINGRYDLYALYINGKKADIGGLIPAPECQSYWAKWYNKDRAELEELFGYIA